ncbi:MAG: ABC transporter substrate-binding protein [Chromatiales bacterium]
MPTLTTRLTFAGLVALTVAVVIGHASKSAQPAATEIEILFIGDRSSSAWSGAEQGLTEANLQGKFLGTSFNLSQMPGAGELLKQAGPSGVLVAGDASALRDAAAALPETPIFNVTLEDDELRSQCRANVLHVIPSKAMKRDALGQWEQANAESSAKPRAWHESAVKYAALQLNKRYQQSAGKPMDDEAWAGWAAVKMLADTAIRASTADPAQLLAFLRTDLVFDGQKGADMTFRPDGQLRQPILIVEAEKVVGEAPVKGKDLDSLGPTDCSK